MGIVCSRPISDFLEDGFLKVAMMIDYVVRMANKYIAECISFCVGGFVPKGSRFARSNNFDRICIPDSQGVCFYPVTNAQKRKDEKRKRSERRKRAEAAALGLKINRKRRGPSGRGYDQVADVDPEEQAHLVATLGQPAHAPPARPAAERETAAERDRGKLWIMGNIPASHEKNASLSKTTPHLVKNSIPDGKHTTKHAGHPGRRSSEGPHIHFDVIASSSSSESLKEDNARPSFEIGDTVVKRMAGQRNQADTVTVMKEVRPRTSSKPSPFPLLAGRPAAAAASAGIHASPHAEITHQAARPAILDSGAMTVRKPISGAPTDVSGQNMLMLSAAPLQSPFENPVHTSKAKQELRKQKARQPNEVRPPAIAEDQPTPVQTPASVPVSKDTVSSYGSGPPLKRLFKVSTASIRSRTSFDGAINGTGQAQAQAQAQNGGFSDTASLAGSEGYPPMIRAPSPMAMADLANRACLSAKDAPRKERKVWKEEVEKIAIQRVLQQDAARRGQPSPPFGKALRRVDTNDGSAASSPIGSVSGSGANTPIRVTSPPPLKRRSSEQGNRRRSAEQTSRRTSLSPVTSGLPL